MRVVVVELFGRVRANKYYVGNPSDDRMYLVY